MKCEVVKDLLPSYIDGLTSSVTNEEIEEHLDQCEECKRNYEAMAEQCNGYSQKDGIEQDDNLNVINTRDIKVLKKFRRTKLKWMIISCGAVAIVITAFFLISSIWIQLPYERVGIEAEMQNHKTDMIEFNDGSSVKMISGGVQIVEKAGMNGFNFVDPRYRSLVIDGKERAILFINCQMTIGDFIFHNEPVEYGYESIWSQGGIDDEDIQNVELVYYLDKGIDQIEDVSEDKAIELIENYGTLLWEAE